MTDVEPLEELLPCENNLVIVPEPHISSRSRAHRKRWQNTCASGLSVPKRTGMMVVRTTTETHILALCTK